MNKIAKNILIGSIITVAGAVATQNVVAGILYHEYKIKTYYEKDDKSRKNQDFMVLLHGIYGKSSDMENIAQKFKNDYRIINIQYPTTKETAEEIVEIYIKPNIEDINGQIYADNLHRKIENQYYEIDENGKRKDKKNDERLKVIIPLLYKISEFLQRVINKFGKIDEIYLTGFGANIKNIDIYFKRLFPKTEIKILMPYFIQNNNSKKFIEYNAAISLAIEGLTNEDSLNFRDAKFENKIILIKNPNKKSNVIIDCLTIISIFIIYISGNYLLNYQIKSKQKKIGSISNYATTQIEKAKEDKQKIESIITEYATAKSNTPIEDKKTKVNSLLNQIYYTIPKNVKLVEIKSIEGTDGEDNKTAKFTLIIQSDDKASIEKFKKDLENSNVLKNIKMSDIDLNTKQASIEVEIK